MEETIEQIKRMLQERTVSYLPPQGLIPAAVLILFISRSNGLHVLITQRSQNVSTHKGDMSFPGGVQDSGDADLEATALRETEEETGLQKDNICILGRFDDYRSIHGHHVAVFVGFYRSDPCYSFNGEIDLHIEVPLDYFFDDRHRDIREYSHEGKTHQVYYYSYAGKTIWGLTALIMTELSRELQQLFHDSMDVNY